MEDKPLRDLKGRFIKGQHQNKGLRAKPNGHRLRQAAGYILEKALGHPHADQNGYVREHRLVYERAFNCCLLSWTVIHHKNSKKDDNRIDNLEPKFAGIHTSEHVRVDMSNRSCSRCGSHRTWRHQRKYVQSYDWYRDGAGGFICKRCYEYLRL